MKNSLNNIKNSHKLLSNNLINIKILILNNLEEIF